jgi:uncharacterized protein (DUF433 family)/predicted nuclease of predicted toxin-antitoxin system
MNYQSIITMEPGKRGGRPCIRRMRIAVADVLGWLAAGMTHQAIIADYPELTEEDIRHVSPTLPTVSVASRPPHEAAVRPEPQLQALPGIGRPLPGLQSGPPACLAEADDRTV